MLLLHMHEHGIHIGHIFWGLWLLPFGYLVVRSGFLPRVLGVLLVIAGLGYLVDLAIYIALPELNRTVTQYTFVGELLVPLWLLAKGVNVERWNQRELAAWRLSSKVRSTRVAGAAAVET